MFRIKICGITNREDALMAARAGADAVGLNFYPKSPRFLSADQADAVVRALPSGVVKVGVFVNSPASDVARVFDRLRLDLIQLHGDEPPEFVAELAGRPVMKAFRLGPEGLSPVRRYLEQCRHMAMVPRMILMDSLVKDAYGGTGQAADWHTAKEYSPTDPSLVLAGGLTPANVLEAILAVRPSAVDTASGVESSPGRKDEMRVRQFVEAAREGFESLSGLPLRES